jgi:ABC-type Co2+ transport system permease subunit
MAGTPESTSSPSSGRVAGRGRVTIVVGAVAGALAVNLVIWLIGRALGGSFVYLQADGQLHTTTAPQGVISMTVIPMSAGLSLAAVLAGRWPAVIRLAQLVGAGLALGTVVMTFTAGFDRVSTIALALMHGVIAVLVVGALEAARRSLTRSTPSGRSRAAA